MRLIGDDYYLKYVIVVDDDVNVFNEQEVLWALATRSQLATEPKDHQPRPQHLS
jgi:UbiD family decarboxylase